MQAVFSPYRTLRDLVVHAAEVFPEQRFFLCSDEAMPHVTGSELLSLCKKTAALLPAAAGKKHVALLGPSSAAWISAYFALLCSGQVVVPLHYGMKTEELAACLRQADCDLLLYDRVGSPEVERLQQTLPALEAKSIHSFLDEAAQAAETAFPALDEDAPAAMYFTSGTTGSSRCVVLTHRNLASQANAVVSVLPLSREDRGLSILPLSHTFEMMTYVVGALSCGGTLYINESLRTVKPNLIRCRPTILVVVPLILQTLQKEILNTARKQGRLEKLETGMRLNGALQHLGIDLSRRLFREVHETFGGQLRGVICGGAALDPELIRFYRRLGIPIYQGYGITECSPVVSTNSPSHDQPGSVGRPLPCCEVRILDGEICVRGESVFAGYYGDEDATNACFRDGWFHTGDLGSLGRDGYLYFTGRLKNLIILPNGENVSPEELEERLYRVEGVRDALVYERDGKITAELFADPEKIPDRDAAWRAIREVNRSLAAYKQIGDIILRDMEFEKTATRKIKRHQNQEG